MDEEGEGGNQTQNMVNDDEMRGEDKVEWDAGYANFISTDDTRHFR